MRTCLLLACFGVARAATLTVAPGESLPAALATVRERTPAGDVAELVLQPGDWYLAETWTIGPDESPLVVRSAPGGRAAIHGGRPLVDWSPVGDGIYSAPLPAGLAPRGVTEDGVAAELARHPNTGYRRAVDAMHDPAAPTLTYDLGELPAVGDIAALQVLVWPGFDAQWDGGKNYDWEASLLAVTAVDVGARRLTLRGPAVRHLHAGNRWFARGAREFLDAPGEYWVDQAGSRLFYRPRREPIGDRVVLAAGVDRIIAVVGRRGEPVRDVLLASLDIDLSRERGEYLHTDYLDADGAVYANWAEGLILRDCRITHAGDSAVAFDQENRGHAVEGCVISDAAYHGVAARGHWVGAAPYDSADAAYINREHRVAGNRFQRCGRLIGHAAGVWLYQSGGNQVTGNVFEELPRYGVQMLGMALANMLQARERGGLGGTLFGQSITPANHLEMLYCRDNRIEGNVFRDVMRDSQDGGAITSYAPGAGNRIANNVITGLRSAVTEGSVAGIYLDDGSNRTSVEGNLIADLRGSRYVFPLIIKGYENQVIGNTIVDCEATACIYVLETPLTGFPEMADQAVERVDRLRFSGNRFLRSGPTIYQIYPWRPGLVAGSEANLIDCGDAQPQVILDWRPEPWSAWIERGAGRFEAGTVVVPAR